MPKKTCWRCGDAVWFVGNRNQHWCFWDKKPITPDHICHHTPSRLRALRREANRMCREMEEAKRRRR